jgi:hypothetical protein
MHGRGRLPGPALFIGENKYMAGPKTHLKRLCPLDPAPPPGQKLNKCP